MENKLENLLTIEDLSQRLGVSVSTARRYIINGVIPGTKLYSRYLVAESDFEKAVKEYSISVKEATELSGSQVVSLTPDQNAFNSYKALSVKEVALLLRCSTKTIYRKVEDRTLPSTKIGGKILIFQKDLELYLANLKRGDATKDD